MAAPLAPVEVIERSRRGDPVDAESVESFVRSWLDGTADDALMSAWCMVACLRGLDGGQVAALTRALIASGDRLELARLGPTGDARVTVGVGDAPALVAAPLAASLGVRVATMAGRGLADTLESIPGLDADLGLARFVRQVRDAGIAVTAPDQRVTPGERRFEALREATGTVPGPGLVAASVMSVALAGGAGAVAVAVGDEEAGRLMAELAEPWGRPLRWLVVDAGRPLGRMVGTALEVAEAGEVLRGAGSPEVRALAVRLAADLAEAAGVVPAGEGAARADAHVDAGEALAAAERWVEAQGGDPGVWTDASALPEAPVRADVPAPRDGVVGAWRPRALAETARWLGAGRLHADQSIDHAVGLEVLVREGDRVAAGEPLAVVHSRDEWSAGHARDMLLAAVAVGDA